MKFIRQCYTFYANSACRRLTRTPWRFPSGPHGVRQMFVHHKGKKLEPFYEVATVPIPIRQLPPLLILNTFVLFLGGASALFFWTQEVPRTEEEKDSSPRYELRPFAQRASLGLLHIGMAYLIFTRLWGRRRTTAGRMWIIPRDVQGKEGFQDTVVVQNFADPKTLLEYTCPRNAWSFRSEDQGVLYEVKPPNAANDYFHVNPDVAIIQGKRVSRANAEKILLDPFTYLENPKKLQAAIMTRTPSESPPAEEKK
ncbi:hypothetical protein F5I97DRAFT_218365 [Phlebopus sp. FC_14]|nr:hypothetical protein F5I97DRAFT_218365 [Phlebopus sp. FC_14]